MRATARTTRLQMPPMTDDRLDAADDSSDAGDSRSRMRQMCRRCPGRPIAPILKRHRRAERCGGGIPPDHRAIAILFQHLSAFPPRLRSRPDQGRSLRAERCHDGLMDCSGWCRPMRTLPTGILRAILPERFVRTVSALARHRRGCSIGMNYRVVNWIAPTAVLANSVLLPRGNPVRVIAYTQYADQRWRRARSGKQSVDAIVQQGGRTITRTELSDSAALLPT
jgi:hypothetical protein